MSAHKPNSKQDPQAEGDSPDQLEEATPTSDPDEFLPQDLSDNLQGSPIRDTLESFSAAIVLALMLRIFIFEAYTIPSGSMIPTLAVGDYIFINKLAYGLWNPLSGKQLLNWSIPERGDVIVFDYPCDEKDYIKRVVAVEGDVVEVRHGYLRLNGVWVNERYQSVIDESSELDVPTEYGARKGYCLLKHEVTLPIRDGDESENESAVSFSTLHETPPEAHRIASDLPPFKWSERAPIESERVYKESRPHYVCKRRGEMLGGAPYPFPWVVPAGHVFVMGDNRDHSYDSRFWGFVPIENIKGRASFIWLSVNPHQSEFFNGKIRTERLFKGLGAAHITDKVPLKDAPEPAPAVDVREGVRTCREALQRRFSH